MLWILFKFSTKLFAIYIALLHIGRQESNYSSSRYGNLVGKTGLFNLGMDSGQGEGKLLIKPC